MKNINSILSKAIFTAAFSILLLNSGYAQNGSGNVIKQDRIVDSFNAIEVGGAFDVYLRQGDREELSVVTDDNVMEYVSTHVSGGTLIIKMNKNFRNQTELKVFVTVRSLNSLEVSGACNVSGKNNIVTENLDIELSGASELELELICTSLEMDVSGASDAQLSGSVSNIEIDASGASTVLGLKLNCTNAEIDASGASTVKLSVTGKLECQSSGASSVSYKGNPQVSIDVSGAGSVKKM